MDEFIAFLVIGLIIIAAMLVVFNVGIYSPSSGGGYGITPSEEESTTTNITVIEGLVGTHDVEIYHPIALENIDVSYTSAPKTYNLPDKRLVNGLLFGSNELALDIRDLSYVNSARLSFVVKDTNKYGPLVVSVNDRVISSKAYNMGEQYVDIDPSILSNDITIKIKPSSSGWFIWAPTVYDLEEIKLSIHSLTSKAQTFNFLLSDDEINNWERGYLAMQLSSYSGPLFVELNGEQQFNNNLTSSYQNIPYNKSNLIIGNNTLSLRAEKNAAFLGRANLLIFYKTSRDNSVTQLFNVSSADYDHLSSVPGRVQFTVTDLYRAGAMLVKINDKNICLSATCYPAPQANTTFTFYFNQSQAKTGENALTIESVDNAAFRARTIVITPRR
ncbi:MAG: hypothetical protein ABIG30_03210 [Candidatus Aenigmatarchaeota archaeon]